MFQFPNVIGLVLYVFFYTTVIQISHNKLSATYSTFSIKQYYTTAIYKGTNSPNTRTLSILFPGCSLRFLFYTNKLCTLFIYLFIYYTVYTHVKSFTIVKNRKCGQVTSHCRKAQPYRADLSLFLNVPVVTVKSEITV